MIELQSNQYTWPVKKALTIPVLILGTERALILLNATLCLAYALASHFTWGIILAPVMFILAHLICMAASKHDPRMIATFRRSTRYRGFFPAQSSIESQWSYAFKSFPEELKNVFL